MDHSARHRISIAQTVALLVVLGSTGCQPLNHTQRGALAGTGIGAATGAIIGHQSGNRDKGALIGAATGALAGSLIGNNQDVRHERDAAIAQAEYEARQANARAMTNQDLIKLSQGGVSESVIINAIHSRGGRFDLSPDAILHLKSNGVSDQVILTIQQASRPVSREYVAVPTPQPEIIMAPEPSLYFIAPPPRRVFLPPPYVEFRHRRHW